jgi:transposase, IS5 family
MLITKRKALPNNKLGRLTEKLEHLKASVRAKAEHPFHVVKNLFRHRKTRYCGLAKNTAQLFMLFALPAVAELSISVMPSSQ